MEELHREGIHVFDKPSEAVAATMPINTQAKEVLYADDGALLPLLSASPWRLWTAVPVSFSVHCCRWALAWMFSLVVHGSVLLLIWGIRLPITDVHFPSRTTVFLSLVSSRSAQSNISGNAISAALPEEHRPSGEQHQKGESTEEKAKLKMKDSRHLGIIRNIVARPLLVSRPKSVATSSSAPQTLPAGGLEASTGVATTTASEDGTILQKEITDGSIRQGQGNSSKGITGGEEMAALPMSEVAEAPLLISRTVPHYPERARLLGIEGLVRLEAILNREGRIEREIKVLESIPLLDEAASTALKQWHFKPARDDSGRPVRVILEVPFLFTLK